MGIDPLSPATRTAKRNLLVVSVLAIVYRAFNVTIEHVPVAGLSINYDNRVFVFLLMLSLIYFFATFLLYYFIDIRNIEQTQHQRNSKERLEFTEKKFMDGFLRKITQTSKAAVPDRFELKPSDQFFGSIINAIPFEEIQKRYQLQNKIHRLPVSREEEPQAYQAVDRVIKRFLRPTYKERFKGAMLRQHIDMA